MQQRQTKAEDSHTTMLSSVKGHLSEIGLSHQAAAAAVKSELAAAAEALRNDAKSSSGWMVTFLVFQAIFFAALLAYKSFGGGRSRDKIL
mmetsp:Transcript_39767/g.92140  ORF Transcript_39767/g.92140 Transcript_39767/m.92140 type:complete len:90 (+) Transcript_39767:211-480(+)